MTGMKKGDDESHPPEMLPERSESEVEASHNGVVGAVTDLQPKDLKFFGLHIPIADVGSNAVSNLCLDAATKLKSEAPLFNGQDSQLFYSCRDVSVPYTSEHVGFQLGHFQREGVTGVGEYRRGLVTDGDFTTEDIHFGISVGYVSLDPQSRYGFNIRSQHSTDHIPGVVFDKFAFTEVTPVHAAVYADSGFSESGRDREGKGSQGDKKMFHDSKPRMMGIEGEPYAGEIIPSYRINQINLGILFWAAVALQVIVVICVIFIILASAVNSGSLPKGSPPRMIDDPANRLEGFRGGFDGST